MLWLASPRYVVPHDIGAGLGLYTSCTAIVQTYINACLKKKNPCFRKLDKYDDWRRMSDLRDCIPVTALTDHGKGTVLAIDDQLDPAAPLR